MDIIVEVDEFKCEAPIVKNTSWSGIRYIFNVDYESNGEDYILLDPTTNLELSIEVKETATNTVVYTGVINPSAPFNANNYQFDVLDYYPEFSNKYTLILTLNLTSSDLCNLMTNYTFPINYP